MPFFRQLLLLGLCSCAVARSFAAEAEAKDTEPVPDGSDTRNLYIVIREDSFDHEFYDRVEEAIAGAFERFGWPTPIVFERSPFEGPPDSVELKVTTHGFSQDLPNRLTFRGWLVVDYDGGKLDLGLQVVHIEMRFGEHPRESEDRALRAFAEKLIESLDKAGLALN